ncbi:hypothetical protein [Neobacillus rhizophilus]|uniref:Uncharacterized protein n=1 Tax=Neobacillus rhizophilus TaxID=2833579 RepID=A0A942U0X3_9BACI|nr:hypothetical protein [Neobacillus rhizophilus]MBS4211235.1 hypothetical protein [Neobacillus rhizophilus]MBU8918758.1 hypothetical protein [Bacillus sp. FJAT-29953]
MKNLSPNIVRIIQDWRLLLSIFQITTTDALVGSGCQSKRTAVQYKNE